MSKYLKVGSGSAPFQEVQANTTSSGAADAGKMVALNAAGKIDITMLPSGVGGDIRNVTAAETISAGDLVYVNSSGEVVRADADNSRPAHGIALTAIANASNGDVAFGSYVAAGFSSLSPGASYYLSTTPGSISTSIPNTSGALVQRVGVALSSSEFYFEPSQAIIELA